MKYIGFTSEFEYRIVDRKNSGWTKNVIWSSRHLGPRGPRELRQECLNNLIRLRRSTGLGKWIHAEELYTYTRYNNRYCFENDNNNKWKEWKRLKNFRGLKNPLNPVKLRT